MSERLHRLLIPVQRLDLARTALAWARPLLGDPQSEVELLGVVPAGAGEAARQALTDGLLDLAGELRAAGGRAETSLLEGDLAARASEVAQRSGAELVVLATPAPPGGEWAPGREAIQLLHDCPAPLLVVDGEAPPRPLRRVLAPLDGSSRAASILEPLAALARAHGAEVTLLRLARARSEPPGPLTGQQAAGLEETLEPALARLTAGGVAARLRVERDPSVRGGILRVGQELEADLLAFTSRGEGGRGEWPFGSVAEGLVRRARVPLLVLRVPPAPAAPEPPPRVALQAPPPRAARAATGAILVPTDGERLADAALAVLPRLVPSLAARALLLSVLPEPAGAEVERREELEAARGHLASLAERLDRAGVPAETHVARGDPAARILAAARDPDLRLVVMTSHARSGVGRWLLGSVTERVLRHADAPVLVISPAALRGLNPQGPRFARLLMADDGSPLAAAALDPVLALARAHASEVTLCGVAPSSQAAPDLVERLRPHRERLAGAGVQARIDVVVGEPVTELLRAAAEADLMAMATHGREGLFRAWLGSITEEVLRRLDRPLLVVRAPSPTHPT